MSRSPAMNKVVLAFSGGLDTSVCVKYLQKNHNLDVITITVDVGQDDDFKEIEKISQVWDQSNMYILMLKKNLLMNM